MDTQVVTTEFNHFAKSIHGHIKAIKANLEDALQHAVDAGSELQQTHEGIGKFGWTKWFNEQGFGVSISTAYKWISLSKNMGKSEIRAARISNLDIDSAAKMFSKRTPEAAKKKIANRVKSGKKTTRKDVREIIKEAKKNAKKRAPEPEKKKKSVADALSSADRAEFVENANQAIAWATKAYDLDVDIELYEIATKTAGEWARLVTHMGKKMDNGD